MTMISYPSHLSGIRRCSSDYHTLIKDTREADTNVTTEKVTRHLLLFAICVALAYGYENPYFLAWSGCYLALNLIYVSGLRSLPEQVSYGRFLGMVALNVAKSWIFAAGLLFIWIYPDIPELRAIACCGVVGHMLRNLARIHQWSALSLTDAGTATATVIIGGLWQFSQAETAGGMVIVAGVTAGITGYYLFAQILAVRDRSALKASLEATKRAGRMSTMGQMTAGLSHDFKNMLAVIQGNIDLAEMARTPEERAGFLEEARGSAEDASLVITRMLATPGPEAQVRPVNLATHLPGMGRTLRRILPGSIDFDISAGAQDLPARVDTLGLEMALLNLVINARDALAGTGGRIAVRVRACNTDTTAYVCVDVEDTGPGIPEDMLDAVTDPFVSTKAADDGSGLGLHMVQDFLTEHGGKLRLENRSQGGLRASMLIPTADPGQNAA